MRWWWWRLGWCALAVIALLGVERARGAKREPCPSDRYLVVEGGLVAAGSPELVVLEGSAHAQFVFQTDQADRLMREILRFLSAP